MTNIADCPWSTGCPKIVPCRDVCASESGRIRAGAIPDDSTPSLIEPIGSTPPNPVNSNHENDSQTEEAQGDRGMADRRSQPLHPEQHGDGGTGVRPRTSAPIGHAPSEAPALQGVSSPIGSTPTTERLACKDCGVTDVQVVNILGRATCFDAYACKRRQLDAARDWSEDFGHENGQYLNGCIYCSLSFVGHKRRRICKSCADKHLAGRGAGGDMSST